MGLGCCHGYRVVHSKDEAVMVINDVYMWVGLLVVVLPAWIITR